MRFYFTLLLTLSINPLYAGEIEIPNFSYIYNEKDMSSLTANCLHTKTDQELTCDFEQLTFTIPDQNDPEIEAIKNAPKEKKVKLVREWKTKCKSLSKDFSEIDRAKFDAICESSKSETEVYDDFVKLGADYNSSTCRVKVNSFTLTFKKAGDKWVSDSSPKGICDLSNVSVLEKEGLSWKYTQTRIAVGSESEFCKPFKDSVGKPYVFSIKFNKDIKSDKCKYIRLGY